ncbi:MAG TPA: TonB-dependent receptor [Sulfurospirillum arcachonense]|nr:TonB-dependent receptor [Sulfurospirillum arcachonense]HIP45041.1 TonB-dependent receptor [Sulfurospirillum arcachonense]
MKNPRGFRGKYFSLAAILALSTTITLANETKSYTDTKQNAQEQVEYSEAEELTPPSDELNVAVISKRIKAKKSKVYSASKSYVSATNVTDNVNILTSEEMKLQGMTTVSQALNSLPGINVTRQGGLGTTTSLFVQGFSNKYTLILIDGVRCSDPTNTSGSDISNLLLDDIDRIEVIKGAQSGVWGADAAAGVINIITKKAKPGTHASVGVDVGSYKYRSLNASLSHRTHSFDVMLSALRTTQDGFTAQAPKGENLDQYEDDAYRNTTVNLKTGYWLNSDNRIEFGYHDINSLSHYDSFGPDSDGRNDYRGKTGYLKYKLFVGKHVIETTVTQSYFHNKQLDAVYGIDDSIGTTPSIEIKDTFKYAKDSMLVFGGVYEKRKVEYTVVGGSEEKKDETNRAIYLNNTNRFDNLVLSQALRYDDFSEFDSKLTGKLGIKYLFNKDFNVYTNYSTGYKTPNMMDMINIWGASNFDLKPEEIKSFNIGLEYKGLNINVFKNEIEDMISWVGGQNVNIEGTSTLKGVELSYQQLFFDKLLLGGNYTYVNAKDANGKRLIRRPRYQVGMNVSYVATKKLVLSADGTYIGSRADQDFSTFPASNVETGNYFLANANVSYKIDKTWNTYFKVNNILDKEYQTVYGYATPRRSFYFGAKANF